EPASTRISSTRNESKQPERRSPPELVEHDRLEERAGAHEYRRRRDTECGERLDAGAATAASRECRGEQDEGAVRSSNRNVCDQFDVAERRERARDDRNE